MFWKIATGLGIVALVVGATAISLWALDGDSDGGTSVKQQNELYISGNPLLATNRQALEVCVDFLNIDLTSADAERAVDNIRQAVEAAAAHPGWSRSSELKDIAETARVDAGCPSGVPPTDELLPGRPIDDLLGYRVDVPSQYLLFVFVMPDDEAAEFVGNDGPPYTAHEYTCKGDFCVGVTSGVYLGIAQAASPDLESILAAAIGLE